MSKRIGIDREEVLDAKVKPFGNRAHVTVPKRWCGSDLRADRVSKYEGEKYE
ncbi:DUF2080 family transposase-associated protein [Halorubraceae archaeon YAN]|nr:DUF2080 family transposase-associated protein [Halorubraceae archaeon YAN]